MAKVTNYQPGPRGINLTGGTTLWVNPGETAEYDASKVEGDLPDFGKAADAGEQAMTSLAEANAEIARLNAIIADMEAKNATPKLPALTGKNKDQLLQIASEEGANVPDGATNNDIIAAIEAKREGA